jgi:hypothetical protein
LPLLPRLTIAGEGRSDVDVLAEVATAAYPIARDDEGLRRTARMTPVERGLVFDDLRRTYPTRREFRQTAVAVTGGSAALINTLRALQFRMP